MSGANYERKLKKIYEDHGWIAVRSAGSFGLDVLGVKAPNLIHIAEVKSTKERAFYFRGKRNKEQWEEAKRLSDEGYEVYYFVYFKSGSIKDRWRVYPVKNMEDTSALQRQRGMMIQKFVEWKLK